MSLNLLPCMINGNDLGFNCHFSFVYSYPVFWTMCYPTLYIDVTVPTLNILVTDIERILLILIVYCRLIILIIIPNPQQCCRSPSNLISVFFALCYSII